MKIRWYFLTTVLAVAVLTTGCNSNSGSKVKVREGVASDSITSNIITRPIEMAIEAVTGPGVEVTQVTKRRNPDGFLEVQVNCFNNSKRTKRFQYKFQWLDADGFVLDSRASVWLDSSITGKWEDVFKGISTQKEAVDFRIDTRKIK
ncbi:MAG: YcfL family protein [Anaerohalosphaera sp.]|nr:YcfL family protein [Anaerohalosphaera sp.]